MRKLPTLAELLEILTSPDILTTNSVIIGGESASITSIDQSKLKKAIYGKPPRSELVSAKGMTIYEIECKYPGYRAKITHEGRFATITEVIEFEE